jgi:hypothetical protein
MLKTISMNLNNGTCGFVTRTQLDMGITGLFRVVVIFLERGQEKDKKPGNMRDLAQSGNVSFAPVVGVLVAIKETAT